MLREYKLTNFKAFGETVTIPIRPITLIFGANSSGKSSIFQSLLLLKQTLEEAKNPETALLPKGSLVDLGTYSDFVHRHETERNFEFGARFDLEGTDNLPPLAQKIIKSMSVMNAGLTVQFSLVQEIIKSADVKADLPVQFFGDKERQATALRRIDLAIGDQKQTIISYFPYTRQFRYALSNRFLDLLKKNKGEGLGFDQPTKEFYNRFLDLLKNEGEEKVIAAFIQLKYEKNLGWLEETKIKPELEFWHHWYGCTKDHIIDEMTSSGYEFYIHGYGGPYGSMCEPIEPDYFETLGNYKFEDAIKDLREALWDNSTIPYENFLPGDSDYDSATSPFDVEYFYSSPSYHSIHGLDISPFVSHVCSAFRRVVTDLVYLGPLRSQPERHYEFSDNTTDYVGQSGEDMPSLLFKNPEVLEQINNDLERLGVKYQLKLSKLQHEDSSPSNVFSLRLIDKNTGIDASLRDVGFGISQVLPIVVQGRLSEKKTLLIEQPEIHLHPAHQAELGDMFIRSALEQKNTFLLETHSEHLLLRIMRRMRETSTGKLPEGAIPVRPEDVAVLFVESDGSQSIVREMPLNERGELVKAWPGGFFEEGLREIL